MTGTGAFTSVSADRRFQVEVADDNNALLALSQLGDGKRSIESDSPEEVEFAFPGGEEFRDDPSLGLGQDSVYEFDRDSNESDQSNPTDGLLRIENQGVQSVEVYSTHQTDSELEIEIYDVTDDDETALRESPVTLDIGEHVDTGFRIRTFDAAIGSFNETLRVVAEASDN